MNDLKNSVAFLFFFLLLIFGVAQVNYIETNVINFSPIFFVLVTLAVLTGILARPSGRFTNYVFVSVWALVYFGTWLFYWRPQDKEPIQVLIIQFMLLEIAAGLAFDVGRQVASVSTLLSKLARSTYPNRTLDLNAAADRISAELTRSRRYQHPLSILIFEIERFDCKQLEDHPALQRDILAQFAAAKIGQIINDRARETDLIMRDEQGRFILVCPETTHENCAVFARRIEEAITNDMGAQLSWGSAFFPGEALTFDDLFLKAEERLEEFVLGDLPAAPQAKVNVEQYEAAGDEPRKRGAS